ncbi:MAG: efflux RND transporter periplasmic adaptor subunit [Rhodothermales bacterium]|nr:efflux RND transporter periplasmic adaptor subunit [Rhodothermales bacterium]MBO6778302.1 efflux RND transporter periplasmic adaptor subunit [Rhodothermales bacterium]
MAKKKNATRRLIIIIGVLAVVALGAVVVLSQVLGGGPDATAVEMEQASVRTLTQVVTASGRVQPEIEVVISPDVSGEIVALPVNEGDRVSQGELLARIKPDFYEAQLEQAQASLLQSRASMAQRKADLLTSELELNRSKQLFENGAIAEAELQTAENRFETAKAGLEASEYAVAAANARLRESREQLAKTAIFAPMDGTVSMLNVELGERVVGTTQMTGTEMMRVAKLDAMEIMVDINENDVVNIALNDSAAIEIDAYPNRTFKGVVTEIANSARVAGAGTQEQVTNFPIKIRILDPHNVSQSTAAGVVVASAESPTASTAPNFRPGMSGTVDVFTETVVDIVAVPIQAVTVRDFNAIAREEARRNRRGANADSTAATEEVPDEEDLRRVVFVAEDGEAQLIEVETGIADDTHIQITSGLSGGEMVIIGPFRAVSRTLEKGDAVTEERSGGFNPGARS